MFLVLLQLKALEISFLAWHFAKTLFCKHTCYYTGYLQSTRATQLPSPYTLNRRQMVTNCKLFHFAIPIYSLLPELISPWLTKSHRISTCGPSLWSAHLGVQAASSWKPGRGGGWRGGGVSKRKRLCPADAMGVSWLTSSETFCLEEKQESLKVCVQSVVAAGSMGCVGAGQGGGYPGFPFKMTAGLWRFRLTDVK